MPEPTRAPITDHAKIAGDLADWFIANARDLPWRKVDGSSGRRDPYKSLVSELMLQQTQVDRVVPKYHEWLDKYPSLGALAAAREQSSRLPDGERRLLAENTLGALLEALGEE